MQQAAANGNYVHGYDPRESQRLQDQAGTLVELLHSDTQYPEGATVLEAGCGVGAQTVTLAKNSPKARITSIDVSETSVEQAKKAVEAAGLTNVEFMQADLFHLPFGPASFDHVFVCFVLEHLARPVEALQALRRVLKPGGSITVIEGDHGSAYFHPDSEYARKAIGCQIELQSRAGGNALIGRELYPLLASAGFGEVRVSPRMVYVDSSKPSSGRRLHTQDIHRHDRGRARAGACRETDEPVGFRPRRGRSISNRRVGWRVLLYVFQGRRTILKIRTSS